MYSLASFQALAKYDVVNRFDWFLCHMSELCYNSRFLSCLKKLHSRAKKHWAWAWNISLPSFLQVVSSIKYQVSSIKYQVSSIKYQVSSIKYQVSNIKYKYQISSGSKHLRLTSHQQMFVRGECLFVGEGINCHFRAGANNKNVSLPLSLLLSLSFSLSSLSECGVCLLEREFPL